MKVKNGFYKSALRVPQFAAKVAGMKLLYALFFMGLLVVSPLAIAGAQAATPAPINLTPAQQTMVGQVEAYLNSLNQIRARVLQLNADGSVLGGTLYIKRPGRLRLDYDAPARSFMVADGDFVHYWDAPLQQTSSVPQAGTPAALILAAQINFTQGMSITGFKQAAGRLEITLIKNDDPSAGELTLVLDESPLKLRQWQVRDASGSAVTVTLQNLEAGAELDKKLFVYRAPNFGQSKR